MTPEGLITAFTGDLSSILADVYVIFMALINILIVLVAGRIIYSAIKHEPVIPDGLFQSDDDAEYQGMLDQEDRKYHAGILRMNAKEEIKDRYKYDV
jgi:hypothetical protein